MTIPDWPRQARALAAAMVAAGVLQDHRWRAAVESTPRHAFVPRFHVQRDGGWVSIDAADPIWRDAVYTDTALITALLPDGAGRPTVVSSSTAPALMLRMLEALDVHDGHRVLEIGTGTGYNAALLCHRLGSPQVFSVDIGADLVTAARERLARCGHTPGLATRDGAAGFPENAPYDRIIATCSVPAVPWAWAEQLAVSGLLLVDYKIGLHAGSPILLRRHEDRLEGRFLPKWAGFMGIRERDGALPARTRVEHRGPAAMTTTRLPPTPWDALVPWFLAHLQGPPVTGFGYHGGGPEWATYSAEDGSWCEVGLQADPDGIRAVRQGGPHPIWTAVEQAHARWRADGEPGWDRFGLTLRPDGQPRWWLDDPSNRLDFTTGRPAA